MIRGSSTARTVVLIIRPDETEYELTVRWYFSPYDPGNTAGPPDAWYPPEGGELIDLQVEEWEPSKDDSFHHTKLQTLLGETRFEEETERAYEDAE